MYLTFELFDPLKKEHLSQRLLWGNDESINYLFIPCFEPPAIQRTTMVEMEEFYKQYNLNNNTYSYMIIADENIVGEVSLTINPEYLYYHDGSTGWISIVIGDEKYRGIGIGRCALTFIEVFARNHGLNRIELGVFSFNTHAINTYQKAGYNQIGVISNFTFYDGQWWDDYRFEKYL